MQVGILSDTHISRTSTAFTQQVQHLFRECQAIIHAGDLTDISILQAFEDKECYGVHGNMCSTETRKQLAGERLIQLDGYQIGITHGHTAYRDLEHNLLTQFPTADCIVFGHTHQPYCQMIGGILFINPGTFKATSPYGAPGTYAILRIDEDGLRGAIHQIPHDL